MGVSLFYTLYHTVRYLSMVMPSYCVGYVRKLITLHESTK